MRLITAKKMTGRIPGMINIAICDDDRPFTEIAEQLLRRIAAEQGMDIHCKVFPDGSDLILAVTEQGMCFDLIYLDIEMTTMNGPHTAQILRKMELPTLIVYISGHEEYLKELFYTEPFRFLSKPIQEEEFRAVFSSACGRISRQTGYFTFFYKKACHRIPFNRIVCFESNGRVISIHLSGPNVPKSSPLQNRFYGKINEVEKLVTSKNGRFLRVHQSFLVNFDYIKTMAATEIEMLDGRKIQISEDRRKTVRERFAALTNAKEG